MKHVFSRCLNACLLLGTLLPAASHATLLGISVNPKQAAANIEAGQTLSVRWVISTTPAHKSGAFSAQGQVIDPVTGAVLHSIDQPLKRADGTGPLGFEETLALTPAQLQEWHQKGISAIAYQRSFGSTEKDSIAVNADLLIRLDGNSSTQTPRAPAAGLFVHKLGLRFENARNRRSVTAGSSLRARLDLQYSGTGLLQGEWQIARDGNGAAPLFTPLVSVRKQLAIGRREFLVSPELPTAEAGQYRVRFCVLPQVMTPEQLSVDNQCPEPELGSQIQYRVGSDNSRETADIELLTPRAITLTPTSQLQWQPVPDTAVYQLQIFKASNSDSLDGVDFVLRMVCGGEQTRLHLSEQARQQLQAGQQYRWRITAHDQNAQLVGTSVVAEFTYMP